MKNVLKTVCFEFLNNEALDNMITCLNYRFDRVVYFGLADVIKKERKSTERFLKEYCDVKETEFVALPADDLKGMLETMQNSIVREIEGNNELYFDITGGESLILVAFGILSERYDTPMHKFDIVHNKCIELQSGSNRHITKDVPARRVELTIDRYIEMRGGIVNYNRQKDYKDLRNAGSIDHIGKIWAIAKKHAESWNHFSEFFRNNIRPDDDLRVSAKSSVIDAALKKASWKLAKNSEFQRIFNEMVKAGLITDYSRANDSYSFRLKNRFVKDCLWDGGSILELHMFQQLRAQSDDCAVGIHLDWDGTIHESARDDVVNEIDVLCIKGNIPTFISCKTGAIGKEALYELDTVAKRFGGKYARKMLAVTQELPDVDKLRAEEMNIDVFKA